jgi:hypothetical protein
LPTPISSQESLLRKPEQINPVEYRKFNTVNMPTLEFAAKEVSFNRSACHSNIYTDVEQIHTSNSTSIARETSPSPPQFY